MQGTLEGVECEGEGLGADAGSGDPLKACVKGCDVVKAHFREVNLAVVEGGQEGLPSGDCGHGPSYV